MHVQKSAAPAAERKQVPTAAPECATAAAAGMQDLTDASIQSLIDSGLPKGLSGEQTQTGRDKEVFVRRIQKRGTGNSDSLSPSSERRI